ncbi:MAG: hypothetical protein HKN48_13950, partial [Flavobacteriaceae bacterium]|nr:hypothetical protein [Flavobacteriaceae bacterium]
MSQADKKITLPQAIAQTTAWRSSHPNACKAFLIPIQDLQGLLAEIQGQGSGAQARAYLAMDGNEEKLVFVGTEEVPDGKGGTYYKDLLPNDGDGDGNGNSIWDFTRPCP